MDLTKITNVEIENIDHKDAPDYCDAFISYAELDGLEMTDEQLEALNENSDFVHECVYDFLY